MDATTKPEIDPDAEAADRNPEDGDDNGPSPKTMREVYEKLRETVRICWKLAGPYKRDLVGAYLATVAIEVLSVAVPWLASRLTAKLAGHALGFRWGDVLWVIGGIQGVWLAWMGIDVVRDLLSYRIVRNLGRDLPLAAVRRLLSLSRRYHQDNNAPELAAKVTRGAGYVTDLLQLMLFNILPLLSLVVGTLALFAWLNPGFAALGVAMLAIYFLLMLRGRLRSQKDYDKRQRLQRRAESLAGEAVSNAQIVQAFNNEETLVAKIADLRGQMVACQLREAHVGTRSWMLRGFIADQGMVLMMLLTIFLFHAGGFGFGTAVFVLALVDRYRNQLFNFGWMYDAFMEKTHAIGRLNQVLDAQPHIVDPAEPLPLPARAQAEVRFENVGFRYPAAGTDSAVPDRWALRGITLDIPAGNVLGIAGESGHGKSTFINLLLRFEDPTEGSVSMNGVDLREVEIGELRERVGYIEQSVRLFNATVRENIAFGRTYTDEEIVAAAKTAGAHEFILKLPNGYDTKIGDRGTKLSGGQQQRLAIARAVVRKPSLLILDEATSSIDPKSIEAIMQALERLKGQCTIIIVSHQLSTLQRLADRIAVVRDGRIAELGTHAQLLLHNGLYFELVRIQQSQERADF